jgi:hypothetical protein
MEEPKQLWGYALFRWVCLWGILFLVLFLVTAIGEVIDGDVKRVFGSDFFYWMNWYLSSSFIVATIWVWRRFFGRKILRHVRVVIKEAD